MDRYVCIMGVGGMGGLRGFVFSLECWYLEWDDEEDDVIVGDCIVNRDCRNGCGEFLVDWLCWRWNWLYVR